MPINTLHRWATCGSMTLSWSNGTNAEEVVTPMKTVMVPAHILRVPIRPL